MNVEQYTQNLPEIIEKARIVNDIDLIGQINEDSIVPTLEAMSESFTKGRFKSPELLRLEESAKRGGQFKMDGALMATLSKLNVKVGEVIRSLKRVVDKEIPRRLATAGMTYRQAATLRTVELLNFYTNYTNNLVSFYLAHEISSNTKQPTGMSRKEEQEISANWAGYLAVVGLLSQMGESSSSLDAFLKAIPEITVDTSGNTTTFTTSNVALDPTLRGFISLRFNPMYYIQGWLAEWDAKKYRLAKEEKEMYELQLLYLENQRTGTEDPTLEKMIQEKKELIAVMRYRMEKVEKKYA